ncbi:MAG: hypothetical protein LC115_06855 [Bacteroidia bacterium]|nr:hypothetical protein [Bacteroidia bacterium]
MVLFRLLTVFTLIWNLGKLDKHSFYVSYLSNLDQIQERNSAFVTTKITQIAVTQYSPKKVKPLFVEIQKQIGAFFQAGAVANLADFSIIIRAP